MPLSYINPCVRKPVSTSPPPPVTPLNMLIFTTD
jgi:hypothetical protein